MFFVVVPFYPLSSVTGGGVKTSSLFFWKKNRPSAEQEQKTAEDEAKAFHDNREQLVERIEQVATGLTGIGLEATILNDEQLTELFYNFYNPQTIERKEIMG